MHTYTHQNPNLLAYLDLLKKSYQKFYGENLDDDLYESRSVIASHSSIKNLISDWSCAREVLKRENHANPVFVFANRRAQELWEMDWQEFINLESRFSAEPDERQAREHLLNEVQSRGFIDNYSGVRVSKTGKRFLIKSARVWQVLDKDGVGALGQAVCFEDYEFVG